jgi:sigma-B regulation protein RsbU (phosphoserine phosphatase)
LEFSAIPKIRLNTIQLAASRLTELADPGAAKRCASIVSRGANRIQHIVGDLLDLSREREGAGIPIDPKPSDMRAMYRQIIDELETITSVLRSVVQ